MLGLEADFQATGLKGSIDAPPCPALVCGVATSASYSQKMPWFGTVRGRIGYATESWIAYATGGYVYARLATDATATAGGVTVNASRTDNRSGWTAGGGVEVALSPGWSAKLEFLYLDFGSADGAWTFSGLPTVNDHTRLYQNVVRTGLNFRF